MVARIIRYTFIIPLITLSAFAQKNIVISDSLAANSDGLKVKMGTQKFGKIWNFRFGDYAVGESKLGWTKTTTKGDLFNMHTDSKSTQKFSFALLNNKMTDTAWVNAAIDINTQTLRELDLGNQYFFGLEADLKESHNLLALIDLNHDTTNIWSLYLHTVSTYNEKQKLDGSITGSDRKILIVPITSNRNGTDTRSSPALGYEFTEDGKVLGAVQYYGGGMMGTNKNIVWILGSPDTKMQLLLAAAMTAILQSKN